MRRRSRPLDTAGIVTSLFVTGAHVDRRSRSGSSGSSARSRLLFFQDEARLVRGISSRRTEWLPQAGQFGIWPLILGTLLITLPSLRCSSPFRSDSRRRRSTSPSTPARRVRGILKPILEILVGIPDRRLRLLRRHLHDADAAQRLRHQSTVGFFNVLSAGIVVGILIVPA